MPDSRQWTVQEVLDVVMQDKPFYEDSGGGVTLSGGEALVQHRFAIALLDAFRAEGLDTAIETTGYCAPAIFEKVLDRIDTLRWVLFCSFHTTHQSAWPRRWPSCSTCWPRYHPSCSGCGAPVVSIASLLM